MIVLAGINKAYKNKEGVMVSVLKDINITIKSGEFVAVSGPEKSEKSTLLKIIGFLETPDSGTYTFAGENITVPYDKTRTPFLRRHIGYLFPDPLLIEEMTVFENVAFVLRHFKGSNIFKHNLVNDALGTMGIAHLKNRYPNQISHFQQHLTALSRSIVAEPLLLLTDDPMRNLDRSESMHLTKLFIQLNEKKITIILSTANPSITYTHRTLNLSKGKIVTTKVWPTMF